MDKEIIHRALESLEKRKNEVRGKIDKWTSMEKEELIREFEKGGFTKIDASELAAQIKHSSPETLVREGESGIDKLIDIGKKIADMSIEEIEKMIDDSTKAGTD